jgi:uncharacterized protein YndB with AHSA1/START domain
MLVKLVAFALALAASGAGVARAEVVDAKADGFQVRLSAQIAAPPAAVWSAIGKPARWWNPMHTFSHDAANLSLDLSPGGCFCETWAGGGVRHQTVTMVRPEKELHLVGALGPLSFTAATATLVMTLEPAAGGTTLSWTYTLGGYDPKGLGSWAAAHDAVLGDQIGRLKAFAEKR